jgi:hypothetical protein
MKTLLNKFRQKKYKDLLGSILIMAGFVLAIYALLDLIEINDINPFSVLRLGFFALGFEVSGFLVLPKMG